MLCAPDFSGNEGARRVFGWALAFLVIATGLGVFLRWQVVAPWPGVHYGHFLHAHSHTAFLGWVFNAYFALALVWLIPAKDRGGYRRLFAVLQIGVIGMLLSFPFQGYGPVSICFSSLHMGASFVFAWRLWRVRGVEFVARGHLRLALVFLIASGLGPVALGPLAAMGLRETPFYHLSIYYYLHAQYNGWFLFFLQAVMLQALAARKLPVNRRAAERALYWLGAGAVLTLAQSTLWLRPPGWVYMIAALGGAAQLVGCVHLVRAMRGAEAGFPRLGQWLLRLALGALLCKHLLQAVAAWPALGDLAGHRFMAVAFLHLVFLGVVAPALLAWGLRLGWLPANSLAVRGGAGLFLAGAVVTEGLLIAVPLNLAVVPSMAFLAAALVMFGGAGLLLAAYLFNQGHPDRNISGGGAGLSRQDQLEPQ